MELQANYQALTQDVERTLLWQLLQESGEDLSENGEAYTEFRAHLEDSIFNRLQLDVGSDLPNVSDELFDEILSAEIEKLGASALNIGNVYSVFREAYSNEILKRWETLHPNLAYPIEFVEIQTSPQAKSISDDDCCADCQLLAYCPGENSVCKQITHGSASSWPAHFDDDGYAVDCAEYAQIENDGDNLVTLPEEQ